MSKQIINVGQSANDRSGDPLRNAFEKVNSNFTELYNAVAADVQIPLQTNNGGKYLTTNGTTLSWATVAGGANTGSVTFDGVKVIGAGTASGDGFGYSTLEIVPDNNLYATSPGGAFGTSGGQYLIIDPTSPQHVHIRAGGVIDQAAAQLILGGEKANVTVRDQDNSYTENHFVTINTADNLGTPYSWNFNNNGDLALPINGGLVFDRANTSIRVGMGFHIASGEGIDIQAIDETDPDNLIYKNWYFSPIGTLTVPSPTSVPFPLVFSSANYVPTVGKPVLTLTDTPWALNGQYAYAPDGRSALALDNIWPTVTNPGYESGDAFTFDSSVHGISGFTLTITLNDVVLAGPAGWTANVSESAPPVYQSTIESNGAIKLTSNINSLILGTDGSVTVSGAIKQGNNKLDLNENNNGNVYLTTTINDSTAMFMTPTSIQTYATESVSLQAGAGLAGLETAYNDQLTMLNDVWQSVSANAGYPWGITLPLSQNTYDELIQLPPGTIGTGEEFLIVTANSVRNAWTTWQNALGDTSVGITVGNNTWAFTPDGNLTLPRDLKFNDGASTISAVDPAQSGGVGGLSVNGKDRTYIGISGNEYGYNWDFRAFGLNDETTAKPTIKFPGNGWLQEDLSNLGIGGFDVPTQLGSQGAFTLTVKDNSTFPDPASTYNWTFGTNGSLTLPAGGDILNSSGTSVLHSGAELVGEGVTQVGSSLVIATDSGGGLTGWSSTAASIAYNANILSTYAVGSTITFQDNTTATLTQVDDYGPGSIDIFWNTPKTGTLFPITLKTADYIAAEPVTASITATSKQWTFTEDGTTTLPGAVVNSTVAKTGSGVPGTGEVATITLNPTNNTNFVPGTYPNIFLGLGPGFTLTLDVAVNGDLTATVISSNGGFVGGEAGSLNGVAITGGTTGVDDIGVTVATLTNIATPTALDLTKQVQKLTDGYYTLANGVEGQIMHLVRQTGATVSITVIVANARISGAQYTTIEHYPFTTGDINMLIFTDGAWQANSGTWD